MWISFIHKLLCVFNCPHCDVMCRATAREAAQLLCGSTEETPSQLCKRLRRTMWVKLLKWCWWCLIAVTTRTTGDRFRRTGWCCTITHEPWGVAQIKNALFFFLLHDTMFWFVSQFSSCSCVEATVPTVRTAQVAATAVQLRDTCYTGLSWPKLFPEQGSG